MSYFRNLRLPAWQMKRLEILKRDNCTCLSCGRNDPDIPLHVHHLKYFAGRKPWEYENHYLATYCEYCHGAEHLIGHQLRDYFMEVISSDGLYFKPMAQLCTLISMCPEFLPRLRDFLNDCMIQYLKTKELKAA